MGRSWLHFNGGFEAVAGMVLWAFGGVLGSLLGRFGEFIGAFLVGWKGCLKPRSGDSL